MQLSRRDDTARRRFRFTYGSILIGGGGFVDIGGGQFVRIGGSQFVDSGGDGGIFVSLIGSPIIPYRSHFSEPVTLPFTTVHSSLNVPSPVMGAFSLAVPYPVILLLIRIVIEWDSVVLRPSK